MESFTATQEIPIFNIVKDTLYLVLHLDIIYYDWITNDLIIRYILFLQVSCPSHDMNHESYSTCNDDYFVDNCHSYTFSNDEVAKLSFLCPASVENERSSTLTTMLIFRHDLKSGIISALKPYVTLYLSRLYHLQK